MHRLLERQLRRATSADGLVDHQRLLDLVSAAYEEADHDRRRSDRSIALMVEELHGVNARLEQQVLARTAELAQVKARLEATLNNADQGIVMISPDGMIVSYNAHFVTYSGLPEVVIASNPRFSDVVMRMIEAGEFEPMGEAFKTWMLTSGGKLGSHSFQRTRPDGTVLQIRSRRLPDGGEARTMTDITELVQRAAEIEQVKQTLEATLSNVTQGILKLDAEHRILVFNKRVAQLLGLPEDLLRVGMPFRELLDFQIARGEFDAMGPDFIKFVRSGGVAHTPQCYERSRPDGTILEVRTVPLANGMAVRTFTDITEQREREQRVARAEAELRSLFENAIVGIYRSTINGQQLRANPALVRMNGFASEQDMIEAVDYQRQSWYVDSNRRQEFMQAIARDGRVDDLVSEVFRYKTGERIWVSESAWLVRDEAGVPLYYEGMVIDATARKETEREIAHIALHDMLTDLPNRTYFLDVLKTTLQAIRPDQQVAVLCLDLDHFKNVNDTLGHDAGDILLRLAAKRLKRVLPRGAMAARFGGDEFAVLLTEAGGADSLQLLARVIVQTLSCPYRIRGKRVYIGASVGISVGPFDGKEPVDLIKKADIALYRAKHDGRGTFACFDQGMTAAIIARREIEIDLRRAILANEFRLCYQPIIDLETNEAVAYEALIRWQHPVHGLLQPGYFIEVAEESGLILPIGEIVLEEACRTFAQAGGQASVAVNLSPVQFRNHQLAVTVVNALASSGLPPHRLVLEITESVLLNDDHRTLDILSQLRSLGVRIALDDFGIGHSSLSYLQKFRFDKIKIDKSFVLGTADGSMNTAIRRAILGLGHDLDIEVVAEGVETELQRDMLIYEGARFAQGYLWGKPCPISEIPALKPRRSGMAAEHDSAIRAA